MVQKKSRFNQDIIDFIMQEIESNPKGLVSKTASRFGVSRITINRYLRKLISDHIILASGTTMSRRYWLNEIVDQKFELAIDESVREDVVWREKLLPHFATVNQNIIDICQYGVTEMVNNVIDHSGGLTCVIHLRRNARRVVIDICDSGLGIFEKIKQSCNLSDPRHALLELAKGKLTTDPIRHSGEGIFFTSRMFDEFSILSGELYYHRTLRDTDDWLIEVEDQKQSFVGTSISLTINTNAKQTTIDIFNRYANGDEFDYGFMRTHVPVRLARYANEQLVSRSQARRVLARFERFSEVLLDFKDVSQIGQAFADEIFRVFKNAHPEIKIITLHTTQQIDHMIKHVESNKS